ncbi:MAG: hypothetical protein AAGG51_21020 [Cyanobacteria bacterium P01_G01_bin.54]
MPKPSFADLSATATDPAKIAALQGDETTLPDSVSTWLGRLELLYGVPFNYLVSDTAMLPIESMRFFQLDFNWIDCLVDGAYSIGRSTTGDMAHDTAFAGQVRAAAIQAARQVRPQALGAELPDVAPSDARQVSGFLLRSAVVNAYPGLEVDGYSAAQPDKPLALLRMERLSPNVLLCLFAGLVDRVRIHEPSEGLHFGVDAAPAGGFVKTLKSVVASDGHSPGAQLDARVNVPFRDGSQAVIEIAELATFIHRKLVAAGGLPEAHPFTAAEFALEMVEGVEQVMFTNKKGENNDQQ